MQYCTFSCVLRRMPTVIFTLPIPISSYSMIIIRSNGFWFLLPSFILQIEIFFAPIRIASSCNIAIVEKYDLAACSLVSMMETTSQQDYETTSFF